MEGRKKKRALATAVGGGAILLTGGMVFAYLATLGTGTGTAQVARGVSVTQDSTMTGLIPSGAAKPIDFTVTNLSTSAPVEIKNVVIAFGSFAAGCSAADFTLVQPSKPSVSTKLTVPVAGSLAFTSGGSGASRGTGASIAMKETFANQDPCKGVTVNLTYTVS